MVTVTVPADGSLPSQVTSFVGRRREVTEIKAALREHRLVTIIGAGGAGKTRLALEVTYRLARSYPGGCWFIDLGKHPARSGIVDHVAASLQLSGEPGQWTVAALAGRLAQRETLLIFDNCEHVVDEVAELVAELLRRAPKAVALATSRQALRVGGERLVHLDGLAYPPTSAASLADLVAFESVALFVERARSVLPDFELTETNAGAVTDIASRLEGMPLAIELTAARLRVLSPQQIANRLENQFRLLAVSRGGDERHHTLRATIEWSYALCSPIEQLAWARLSVFPADFDLNAAEAVAAGGKVHTEAVFELVSALIDKSILRSMAHEGDNARYRFSEAVRDFGRDKLAELEPNGVARTRLLEHFSRIASAVPELLFGPFQFERNRDLSPEKANLHVAMAQALAEHDFDAADSLACAIALVAYASGSLGEAVAALDTAAGYENSRSTARVRLLWLFASIVIHQGDVDRARRCASDCRRMAQLIGDDRGIVHALQYLGHCDLHSGDIRAAERHCRDALKFAREINDDHLLATVLVRHALVMDALGKKPEAQAALEESIAISDRVGEKWCRGFALWNLAVLLQGMGRPEQAISSARAALDSKITAEDDLGTAQALEVTAWCAADLGDAKRAAVLLGAAEKLWAPTGAVPPAKLISRHDEYERRIERDLGSAVHAELTQFGRSISTDEAIAWVSDSGNIRPRSVPAAKPRPTGVARPAPRAAAKSPLTAREQEVTALVAQGLTNREIAEQLVIAPRTAEAHVEHILAKLGFTSRAQIRAWASYAEHD